MNKELEFQKIRGARATYLTAARNYSNAAGGENITILQQCLNVMKINLSRYLEYRKFIRLFAKLDAATLE